MRTLITTLLATAMLIFGAASASAYALTAQLNPGSDATGAASPSDQIIIDVYLDAEAGLGFLGFGVVWDDNGSIAYDQSASSVPTYILYAGGKPATYLIPNIAPPGYWGGINLPGKAQVQVEYFEVGFGSASASGTGIWVATLVFHVTGAGGGVIDLTLGANGAIVESYGNNVTSTTTTSGSFTLIPEPTTALLIGFGLAGLALAGRRQD